MNRKLFGAKFRRDPDIGFSDPVLPDESLSAVVGTAPLPRSEMIARLWDYIRKHGLQDPARKMTIYADDKLRPIFEGRSQVSIFELLKLMSAHLRPHTG